jgi:hypothetical protein
VHDPDWRGMAQRVLAEERQQLGDEDVRQQDLSFRPDRAARHLHESEVATEARVWDGG